MRGGGRERLRRSQRQQSTIRAPHVPDEALGMAMSALEPADPGDLLLEGIKVVRALAGVGVASPPLTRLRRGDVDVVRR